MSELIYKAMISDMTWSYSRVSGYDNCPYAWFLKYIECEEKEDKFYSSYGSFIHKIIEKYYKGKLSKDELLPEFLINFSSNVKGIRPSQSIVTKYIQESKEYFNNFNPFPFNTVDVEKRIKVSIGGIPFIGVIDYIGEADGDYYIIDNKSRCLKPRSTRKKPTKTDAELDEYLKQLYIYSTYIKDTYGKFPKELCFNCFRNGQFIREPFVPEKYEETCRWVVETINRIKEDENFYPYYDYFYCRWLCDVHNSCEVYLSE